jgi:hypothetical protein
MFGANRTVGATFPGPHASTAQALAMEVLLSAGLINTIPGTASGARNIGANGAISGRLLLCACGTLGGTCQRRFDESRALNCSRSHARGF